MNFLRGFVLGIVLTLVAVWYFKRDALPVDVQQRAQSAATNASDYVREKIDQLNLSPDQIKAELASTGAVIRRKADAAGAAIADAAADARITAAIKAKIIADSKLSALSISVSTTDGLVTMSGTATSSTNVEKAVQTAWDTEGVKGVVSTIGVKE